MSTKLFTLVFFGMGVQEVIILLMPILIVWIIVKIIKRRKK
jgi:hypothetical protein